MQRKATAGGPAENKMGTMNVWRLIVTLALPIAASMLVQALYGIVDSIYISRISESAVTAISLQNPVHNLLIGFATSTAVGVNALLSRALGQNDRQGASRALGNGIFLVLVISAGFMLFGIFGVRPFFEIQSEVPETITNGIRYTRICCVFALGVLADILLERALQAAGKSIYSMISQCVGAGLNILLDPILIFGWFGLPEMGIAGAAVATVVSQWIAAGLSLFFNIRFNTDLSLGLRFLRPRMETIRPILTVGIPSLIMVGLSSVVNFVMNQILQGFSESATGVLGIYYRLQGFFFMPIYGINNAVISIVAFNYGAKKPDRMVKTVKNAAVLSAGIALAGVLVFLALPDMLLGFFKPSEEFLKIGRTALRVTCLGFVPAAVSVIIGGCFQALGNGVTSSFVSLCRQMIVLLPAAYILSLMGVVGTVWWAFPIAEILGLAVAMILYSARAKPAFLHE